jgi:OOP family OmpA-OmpF porin
MMRRIPNLTIPTAVLALCLAPLAAAAAECDNEGTKELPYFTRMPNYCIEETGEKEFDAYQVFDGKKVVTIEGRVTVNSYILKEEATPASELQIRRNYENALRNLKASFVYNGTMPIDDFEDTRSGADLTVGRIEKDGRKVWLEVVPWGGGDKYVATLVEVEGMKQEVSASDMLRELNAAGRVALSINFDTGKATIRPESKPVVDEIITLLKDNPALKVSVEGHTDTVGEAKSNKILSEKRAQAVRDAIVAAGVDTGRLSAVGWGQEKPVADNATEEGRARNRRVELVRK